MKKGSMRDLQTINLSCKDIFLSPYLLALPSLKTLIIDPSEHIHLSLLRITNSPNLQPILREDNQDPMPSLDFPALVNFIYNKNGIGNALHTQAHAHRTIVNDRPDPEFYVDHVYEGHICHELELMDEKRIQDATNFLLQ